MQIAKNLETIILQRIVENNGKLTFKDLLEQVGGEQYKALLYKATGTLAHEGKIVRIKGLGERKIEFYYHIANNKPIVQSWQNQIRRQNYDSTRTRFKTKYERV